MGNCLPCFKYVEPQQQLLLSNDTDTLQEEEPQLTAEEEHVHALIPKFLSSSFSSIHNVCHVCHVCPHPKHWLRSYLENYILWQVQDWKARFCKREYLYVVAGTIATEIVVYLMLHGPRRIWTSASSSSHYIFSI